MTLTPDLYQRFIDLIYKRTGIWFETNKRYFVDKRLDERIAELGLENYREYYQHLKFSTDQTEMQQLINRLTINETYFFRDFPQLQGFAEEVLLQVVKDKVAAGNRKIKLWSAGCSTGEEPYTLAIILLEMLPEPETWTIEILASDINTRVLDVARKGYYNSRSVKDVPTEYLERYFARYREMYILNNKVRNMVNFKVINLMEQHEMKLQVDYDFIFCRNVLIYFTPESRLNVLESYYRSLKRGGYIYLGHSESVARITDAFKMRRIGSSIVYYKP
ncbi:CheR family methyltransferase [Pelosinus sp. sgz500959]|uniref:CheR family methyltransferase n=1 Tax=Pelosinus sp. sgz500959 TaxID=3242472 RepID=UPI00366CB76E